MNLSSVKLTDDDFTLLGKGLKFCPKSKSHDKLKIAEDTFKFSRRLRLKEYFSEKIENSQCNEENEEFNNPPFFNKKDSTFIPHAGRDLYLDLYIEAITEEILQSGKNSKRYSNISKAELSSLRKLSRNESIVIKKADKSNTIVIMNRCDYESEVLRQLNNQTYYEKVANDPSESIKQNISECIKELNNSNSSVTDQFDTFPTKMRTPVFYVLPKTHKTPDNSLPLHYPGRPIVSACNSPTENISKYIDYVLKPVMFNLPSFVKDTSDFISKVKGTSFKSKDTFLVTLDVSSLYTNIPHEDGVDACKYFLDKGTHVGKLSSDEVARLIKLVLENNHFKCGDNFYLQKMGTAMGSSMAPAYASLFMGKLEEDFLNACALKPTLWLRFLDDIFMIWDHSLEVLHSFINKLNKVHSDIKVTHTISQKSVSFLDINISKGESLDVCTDDFEKETSTHKYLDYTSCHHKKCKDSIPHSQAKRYRRIASDVSQLNSSLAE